MVDVLNYYNQKTEWTHAACWALKIKLPYYLYCVGIRKIIPLVNQRCQVLFVSLLIISQDFRWGFSVYIHIVLSPTSRWQKNYWLFYLDTSKKINSAKHCTHKQKLATPNILLCMYVTENNNPKPESLISPFTAR